MKLMVLLSCGLAAASTCITNYILTSILPEFPWYMMLMVSGFFGLYWFYRLNEKTIQELN